MKPSERRKARREGWTDYSEKIEGNERNYKWPVTFDMDAEGYLGITQNKPKPQELERVLLTPAQVDALMKFIKQTRKKYSTE